MANQRTSLIKRLLGAGEQRSEPLPGVIPPDYSNSQPVTVATALSISAIYSAVNILGTWVSQMDLEVQRAGQAIPTPALIAQPDTDASQQSFLRSTVTSVALSGDFFWKKTYSQATGQIVNLKVLNPFAVQVDVKDNGTKFYRFTTADGKQVTYTDREITHGMVTEIPGRLRGLGVIEANNNGIKASLELRKYADNWFNGSGVPKGGYLKSDKDLEKDQLAEVRKRWASQQNDGLGMPAVGQGMEVQSYNLDPAQAMFLEQQTFAVTEIARWFGIPPYLMLASVDGNSMTYSNLQTDTRLFVTNTLMGYMLPIQDALTALIPRGQVVKFKTEALLRGDTQERYEAYNTAIAAGFLTVNEVRSMEGWAPLTAVPIEKEGPPDQEI